MDSHSSNDRAGAAPARMAGGAAVARPGHRPAGWVRRALSLVCALAGLLTTTVALSTATAAPAAAAAERGAGFVWAHDANVNGCYHPNANYSGNDSALADYSGTYNQVCRTGTGRYQVRFNDLGVAGGIAHATAYGGVGAATAQCKVLNWFPNGGHQYVNVSCHRLNGTAVNTQFTLSYTNVDRLAGDSSAASFGYVWSGGIPAGGCWNPSGTYQYHSGGGSAQACRNGTGSYSVSIPNLPSYIGSVQVTAYGGGSDRCKVAYWGTSVAVRCFAANGQPADSPFTLSYGRHNSLLGLEACCHSNGWPYAYAWAFAPGSASYDLGTTYHANSGYPGDGTGHRLAAGQFATRHDVGLDDGTVNVTAYGSGNEFCKVAYWNSASGIRVNCYNASGGLTDTRYTVAFSGRWVLG